jgi:Flp pilus assembly protein TadG
MIMLKASLVKFLKSEDGVAAIEISFIFPFLIFLYFGLIDVTGLISYNRKITSATSLTSDLIAQERSSILKSRINDIFNATSMIMAPTSMTNVRIEVYGYRNVANVITLIWKTDNGQGPACAAAISTSTMLPLMAAGNDVVVTRTCMNYTPYIATFLGKTVIGKTSFGVNSSISVRPRNSTTLNCYRTTVAAGTLCP